MSKQTDCIVYDIYHNQLPALQYIVNDLRKKVSKDSQLINNLQERVNDGTNGVACNCESELMSINSIINQYGTTFHNIDINISAHQNTIENHTFSIGSLTGNFNTMSENISTVDNNVRDLTNQVNSIDNRLNELSDKVDIITPAVDESYTPEKINCFATYVKDTTEDFRDNAQAHYLGYDMHVYKPTQWDKYDEERSKEEYANDALEITNIYINPSDDSIFFQDFIVDFVAKVQERTNVIADCGLTLHLRRNGMETCPHSSQYEYMAAWIKLLEWTSRVIIYADEKDGIKVDPETLKYRNHPIGKITEPN